jgi:RimJ/RimL family protein N-acetyltransferase
LRSFPLAVEETRSGRLVGAVEVGPVDWTHLHAELGYWIDPRRWGRGFATEAAERMVAFAFEDLGLHRLHAGFLPFNERSRKVLKRIGFRKEGVLQDYYRVDGKWSPVIRLALFAQPSSGTTEA